MGLGFCRFVDRSRLYPPPRGATGGSENSNTVTVQKDGNPATATSLMCDRCLVGPNDSVTFFAEVRDAD